MTHRSKELKCNIRIVDMELAILRIGESLNIGETLSVRSKRFEINIDHTSNSYACFVLNNVDDDHDIYITYEKGCKVTPKLDIMLTEADCNEYDGDINACDVSCRVDTCTLTNPAPVCRHICLDKDFICDKNQQCPYGEDESCGSITTVTPAPSTLPTTTVQPSMTTTTMTPFPPHITRILVDPSSRACKTSKAVFDTTESVITSQVKWNWQGNCIYRFKDIDKSDDSYTLINFVGSLSDGEEIDISDYYKLDKHSTPGSCVIIKGKYKIKYSTSTMVSDEWMLVMTPIDCDDDNHDCEQSCKVNSCLRTNFGGDLCKRMGCINKENICDGVKQCPLEEDENCESIKHTSLGMVFTIIIASLCIILIAVVFGLVVSNRKKRNSDINMDVIDNDDFKYARMDQINFPTKPGEDTKKHMSENIYETA
ncbi:hypothetical protein GJ496_001347 [Pomphorhynchus laevis]|nr:hypothetical protein GJ496_001347 [Pomphorhynchus laevis]